MSELTNEKFGTIVFNGKIYNLDTMSAEELEEMSKNVEVDLNAKNDQLDRFLKIKK